jgi:hypothetical protein
MDHRHSLRSLIAIGILALAASAAHAKNISGVEIPKTPEFPTANAASYGKALAKYMDRYDAGWADQYVKATMTLYDARDDSVTRKITQKTLEGTKGDKTLIRFLGPAEIRGVAALVHERPGSTDDSWLYLPASRRVRRISGANRTASFQGTEFTYEDLSSISVSKYDWKHIEDGALTVGKNEHDVFILQAVPNYSDTGYSRLVVYLNQKHWRVEKIEFFDKAKRKLKTLTFSKWDQKHGRFWRAARLDMRNHQTKKRTLIEMDAQFVNLALYPKKDGSTRDNLNAKQFTRRALEAR